MKLNSKNVTFSGRIFFALSRHKVFDDHGLQIQIIGLALLKCSPMVPSLTKTSTMLTASYIFCVQFNPSTSVIITYIGRGGALVESIRFDQRVEGSNPALAAM